MERLNKEDMVMMNVPNIPLFYRICRIAVFRS